MSEQPYKIVSDPDRLLVTISFRAVFWDESVSASFIHDCIIAVSSMKCDPANIAFIVYLRNAVLQSKEIYDRMLGVISGATARRIALVAQTPLARMQTKRLQVRNNVVLFDDLFTAEMWLFSDVDNGGTDRDAP